MPFSSFALALACGCVPVGFAYAAIGQAGQEHPALAIGLSIAAPALLWIIVQPLLKRRRHGDSP
jgi:uncharacterized membrane protein YdjX (TVP38/TMEM64 family)